MKLQKQRMKHEMLRKRSENASGCIESNLRELFDVILFSFLFFTWKY